MRVSYDKLWKLLIDKKMSQADLRRSAHIAPNTLTRLRREQEVSMSVLFRICETLGVGIDEVMEFTKKERDDCL